MFQSFMDVIDMMVSSPVFSGTRQSSKPERLLRYDDVKHASTAGPKK
ncbi:MAG: hypothetical protein ACR2OX_08230 [Methyloligellaceae bacterium]